MRIGFSSSCAIGLAIALTLGAVSSADAQQRDTTHRTRRRATSAQRIPISKERPSTTSPGEVTQPAPTPTPTVNQDSIAAVERARQDSIAAAERARQEEMARVEQMRRDSIAAAERRRQDSIAAVERARQESIARADSIARAVAAAIAMRRWAGGFYIGVAGGASMPMGDLKNRATNSYNTGWNVTVPFGWDFHGNPFGIRFDGSYDNLKGRNNFTSNGASGGTRITEHDATLVSLNGDVKLRVPLGRTWSRFYVLGGGGASRVYGYPLNASTTQKFSDAKTNWNWNAGAGFNFNFGRMTGLFLESRYISMNADASNTPATFPYKKANFVPIILGIQF